MKMLSVDESIVPDFGRHGCKQFNRGEPILSYSKYWFLRPRQIAAFNLSRSRAP